MTVINDDFQYCIEKFGPPLYGEQLDVKDVDVYRSKVTKSLVDFWRSYGVGIWLHGRFQLCRPDKYQGLVSMILKGDPDFPAEKSVLIGFSAFGTLLIWNNENYFLRVDLVNKMAYTQHLHTRHPILDAERALPSTLDGVDDVVYDFRERTSDAKPLFSRAMKKCGKLAYGECYGFVPAVGLGGRGVLDEVQRVRALEHFSIIAQLAPIQLRYMDTEKRKIVVLRELGG